MNLILSGESLNNHYFYTYLDEIERSDPDARTYSMSRSTRDDFINMYDGCAFE